MTSNPIVFFDIEIGGDYAGRLEMELRLVAVFDIVFDSNRFM